MYEKIEIDYSKVDKLSDLLTILHEKKVPKNQYWLCISSYHEWKAREKAIPRTGLFELTPLCNLDCKMCYVHLEKEQLNGKALLSVSEWKEVIFQAHMCGMLEASLTGGECLTYPGFEDVFLYMRSIGVKPSIKTNGILLDKERFDFFNEYQPKSINISLYGSSNAGYKKVTGHAAFDVVYRNLLRLRDVNYPVSIDITPSKYMLGDIDNIIDVVNQLGFPYSVNLVLFQPRNETGRKICDLSSIEYVDIFKSIKPNNDDRKPCSEAELPECSTNGSPQYGLRCGAGRSSFNISWNGLMTACENLKGIRVSLLENSFSEAWETINAEAINYPTPRECSECVYDKVCFSCAAYRGNGMEKGHCNPQICERTRLLVKEGIYKL